VAGGGFAIVRSNSDYYIRSATRLNPKKRQRPYFCNYRNFEKVVRTCLRGLSLLASAAAAEKLKFVLKISEAAFLGDLFFEMFHRAGDIEDLDRAAISADEIILMMIFAQAVMGCAAVETDAADDAALLESAYETIDRCGIARDVKSGIRRNLLQGHGLVRRGKDFKAGLKRSRPAQAGRRAFRKEVFDTGRFTAHTRGAV